LGHFSVTSERELGIALGTPNLLQCTISVNDVTGTTVAVSYAGLPANQPQRYQDFVALWEGTAIAWSVPPLRRQAIPDDAPSGTIVIDQVRITRASYTVAYGVGRAITDACASALIAAGGQAAAHQSVTISVNEIGTTSLSVHYATLSGYLPATYGNWLGLWEGEVSPYNAPRPLARTRIPNDVNEGDVGINGVEIAIGTTYTLIYLMGAEQTTAAALLTFTTDDE
jgi:hypothetical protein